MISNVRDNPHGKEFKEWAKKVTRAFNHRNINVTTKHTYAIDYKYIWTCVSCGHEFKRHSKSIDPAKHRCGSCKAELMQTKPVVRQKDPNKGPSEYQVFMKENFQRIKRENDGKGHKEIMEILGKEYREHKAKKATVMAAESDLTSVTRAIETIALDD
ncbi:SprT-like protein [Neofusicoccum parvum]|uniref:Putative hmg box-containing protein n=1 Tax=Botryosphaeria parva (strain UCR-NP2) TaxID=1287680 RepID=R1EKR2_BOTPV|nr:putative hmg box-containing protein [Neofusicoccum parvum UCRNP2]GME35224.1 SprT-like protein [Neofusicoccum parvum]